MFKILDVEIKGFWGKHTIKTSFKKDINIFIGLNGTGKTTFINILQSIFEVDIERLYDLQFEKATLNLAGNGKTRKIEVVKVAEDLEYKELNFKIGSNKYSIPYIPSNIDYRRSGRFHPQLRVKIDELREAYNTALTN